MPTGSSRSRASVAWRLAPLAVGLGSLCLGAVALGRTSLSTDEAESLARARQPFGDLLHAIVHDDPVRAGHLLALKAATTFGTDAWAIRASSVIAVATAAALLVVLGTMLLGRVAGLVAGVALATNAGVVVAAREARPYALGLAGVVVATLLLVVALDRSGAWWVPYGISCVALPLTHPLAASVLLAHGAALIALRDRARLRTAGIALTASAVGGGLLLAWMVADRLHAPDGAAAPTLAHLGRGLIHAGGWSPVLAAAAIAGLIALFSGRNEHPDAWRAVLVAGLIGAPVAGTLLAAVVLPVYVGGALVLCAPGISLAAGAAVPLLRSRRALVVAGAALVVVSAVTVTARIVARPSEDWRALATAVRRVRLPQETVVIVPERARAAFAYYAPDVQTSARARGDGAWIVVVADDPSQAIERARQLIRTPTYALLRQFSYGNGLRLQHWVRP